MSAYQRVRQWNTFAQVWHVFDAKWQNPFISAPVLAKYLKGSHKPIYHPMSDTGDHVVVINSRHIAMPGEEWRWRSYFHHTGYAGGATWTYAWELHEKNPTLVMYKAVTLAIERSLLRRHLLMRLHIFPEDEIPEDIKKNISNQIPVQRPVPRSLLTYSDEEIANFPKIIDYPKDYEINRLRLCKSSRFISLARHYHTRHGDYLNKRGKSKISWKLHDAIKTLNNASDDVAAGITVTGTQSVITIQDATTSWKGWSTPHQQAALKRLGQLRKVAASPSVCQLVPTHYGQHRNADMLEGASAVTDETFKGNTSFSKSIFQYNYERDSVESSLKLEEERFTFIDKLDKK